MSRAKGKPSLIALDFRNGTARRYKPKPTGGGFFTQEATVKKETKDPWRLGSDEGLELLEGFRTGQLDVQPITDEELEQA